MSRPIELDQLHLHLPDRIWYLTGDGSDIYCRRPYSFLFGTSDAAVEFARAFGVEGLDAVGLDARDLALGELMNAFRAMSVTRLFIDPSIDPDTGDVFGTILRLPEPS